MPRRSIRRKSKRRTKHIKVIGGSDRTPQHPAPLTLNMPTSLILLEQILF